jgi:hypothetical protein
MKIKCEYIKPHIIKGDYRKIEIPGYYIAFLVEDPKKRFHWIGVGSTPGESARDLSSQIELDDMYSNRRREK